MENKRKQSNKKSNKISLNMAVKLRKKAGKGKESYYLDIYHNGKRSYEFLKIYTINKPKNPIERQLNKDNKELAENIRAKREIEINSEQYNFNPKFKKKTNFFVFASHIAEKHKGRNSYYYYKATVNHFKNFLGTDFITIGSIDSPTISNFKEYLYNDAGLSKSTPHSYFARFKTIFKEAIKEGIILKNPADIVKNESLQATEKVFLTIPEIQQLASTPCKNNEVKKAFLFACNTGLRHIDVYNLTWNQIKKIEVNSKVNFYVETNQQKTKRPIQIKLNNTALQLIGKKRQTLNEKVFHIYSSVGHTNQHLKVWSKTAGIDKNITFHTARHSFATILLIHKDKTKADLYIVSKLLGHTSVKHTQIYAKIVDSMTNEATSNIPSIELNI